MHQVTFQVYVRSNGNLRPLLGRKNFNYCDFVKKHRGNTIFDSAFDNILKFSNISKGCPVPPARYAINGFVIELSKIPSIIPSGNYFATAQAMTLEEKKKIVFIQGSAEVQFHNWF